MELKSRLTQTTILFSKFPPKSETTKIARNSWNKTFHNPAIIF